MIDIYISTLNREDKLRRCVESIIASTYKDWRLVIRYNIRREILVKGANREIKEMRGDWYLALSDDIELLPDTLQNLISFAETNAPDTDAIIGLNQINIADAPDSAICMTGRKFAERFPDMKTQCEDYFYFGADREIDEYAKSIGKFFYCQVAQIIHHHPAIEPQAMDRTHQELRDATYAKDMDMREKRRSAGLLWGRDFKCLS